MAIIFMGARIALASLAGQAFIASLARIAQLGP
jgi:hypothetical protein